MTTPVVLLILFTILASIFTAVLMVILWPMVEAGWRRWLDRTGA